MTDADFSRFSIPLSTQRRVFQRLFERAQAFAADVPNANERANAVVKTLEILRLERSVYSTEEPDAAFLDDWRRRAETTLDDARRAISTVESRGERSYLRRLALDAALALNAFDATFFNENAAVGLLAEIDDAEERQNALAVYSNRLADRIFRFKRSDGPERAKAFAALDEIEDLRSFERAAGAVVAAVLFAALQRNDAPKATFSCDATLDLTPFGTDVADVWEQFESPGGFLELCERAANDFLDLDAPTSASRQEIELRQAFNAETSRRLAAILTALDSGRDADGTPLDASALEELQTVVVEAIVASPFALERGEFFRTFFERAGTLDAFFPVFERLAEAEKATRNDANACLRSFYRLSPESCAQEKERWLDSLRRVANDAASNAVDVRVKLDRLTTYVELEFRFGDKTKGKEIVRDLLTLLPRLDSPFERARFYRRLVATHLDASYPKAAQKLARLWESELAAVEPDDLRDAAFVDAFDLYSQVANFDATTLSKFTATVSAPLARLEIETSAELDLLRFQEVERNSSTDDKLDALVESTFRRLETLAETPPDEAVFALVKIADAFARRVGVPR